MDKIKIFIVYHYLYPDDVVSSLHFTQLALELKKKGYIVETLSSNRSCRKSRQNYSKYEVKWNIHFNRSWRPDFAQSSFFGRIFNSIYLQFSWLIFFLKRKFLIKDKIDHIILGTDPIFLHLIIIPLKFLFPKTKFILWSFDLYPDAYIAKKNIKNIFLLKPIIAITKYAYGKFNHIVDIGQCMREKILKYGKYNFQTIIPWSIFEEDNIQNNFIKSKPLSILYSGNMGEAHDTLNLIRLIKLLQNNKMIEFYFSLNNKQKLSFIKALGNKNFNNVKFLDSTINYIQRLKKFDIHLVTLKKGWEGIVVPSKFFSSLSLGKPILYVGPKGSSISYDISRYDLGWTLNIENFDNEINKFAYECKSIEILEKKSNNCIVAYNTLYSKKICINKWIKILGKN